MVIRHALNTHVECLTKGRKVCFPPREPQYGSEARFLCGRILGSLLVKRSSFLSQQVRRGKCPLIQGGSRQNKHTGDGVSQLVFSLLFLHCLFPSSPIQAFPELYIPAAAAHAPLFLKQNIYDSDEGENMTAHFKTRSFVIMAVGDPVLHSSRVCSCKQTQTGCTVIFISQTSPYTTVSHTQKNISFISLSLTNRRFCLVLANGPRKESARLPFLSG